METNPQHETGRWLRLGAPRGQDEAEILDDLPEPEESSRLYTIREMARGGEHPDAPLL